MNNLQDKVLSLNVKELQECLDRLHLKKQGKKAELQQRVLGSIGSMKGKHSMESVYQVLDAVLSKRQERGRATSSSAHAYPAGASTSAPDSALRELIENMVGPPAVSGAGASSSQLRAVPAVGMGTANTAIRCICGNHKDNGKMVQCEDEACGFWQHCACVGITSTEQEQQPHYCEYCRLKRADPFWEVMESGVLRPSLLQPINGGKLPVPGQANAVPMFTEKSFHVSNQHLQYRHHGSQIKMQLSCLQLMDPNPFRIHWPQQAEVRINQMHAIKPYPRNGQNKLGANQRDEPVDVFHSVVQGTNKVRLTCVDTYQYAIIIQLARRRNMAEVRALLKPPQCLADALQRVVHTLRGGEGEEDDDCVVENTVLSLRCPLTGARMKMPARFSDVPGIACFDLEPFLQMAERTRKWQCPHSMRNTSIQTLQVDAYVQRILDNLRTYEDVTEVEIGPDGRWRPAGSSSRWFHIDDAYQPAAQPVKREAAANGDGDSDEESEDEMEELRRAAQAVAHGNKRQRQDTEVIDLLSDSDDDAGSAPPAARPRLANGVASRHASHAAAGPGPSSMAQASLVQHPPQSHPQPTTNSAMLHGSVAQRSHGGPMADAMHGMRMPMQGMPHSNHLAAAAAPPTVARHYAPHGMGGSSRQLAAAPAAAGLQQPAATGAAGVQMPGPSSSMPAPASMYPMNMPSINTAPYPAQHSQHTTLPSQASQHEAGLPGSQGQGMHYPMHRALGRQQDMGAGRQGADRTAGNHMPMPAGSGDVEIIELDSD